MTFTLSSKARFIRAGAVLQTEMLLFAARRLAAVRAVRDAAFCARAAATATAAPTSTTS